MGLDNGPGGAFAGLPRALRGWLLPGFLALAALAAAAAGEPARALFRYGRVAIAEGEVWRLLTGHFVHLGAPHLWMNLLALVLIWVLVGHHLKPLQWLLATTVILAGIDAGFWWLEPRLEWYVGLSGVLHGLLAAGLLAAWREVPAESAALGAAIAVKLGYEQLLGPLPGSESLAGGAVVVNAHLYGAVAGVLAAIGLEIAARVRHSRFA